MKMLVFTTEELDSFVEHGTLTYEEDIAFWENLVGLYGDWQDCWDEENVAIQWENRGFTYRFNRATQQRYVAPVNAEAELWLLVNVPGWYTLEEASSGS